MILGQQSRAGDPPGCRPINVGVAVGSLSKHSINRKLAKAIIRQSPAALHFHFMTFDDLPYFNQDDTEYHPAVQRVHEEIASLDAFLFVTPELNRAMPAVLKNLLDWGSRRTNRWAGKPAAVVGASIGALGTAPAQAHLRNVLSYLDMRMLNQPEVYLHFKSDLIDEEGRVSVASTEQFLRVFIDRFHALIVSTAHRSV